MFDDGVEGVYQLREETATTVRKETQVNDPDIALEDADAIFGKMQTMIFQGAPKAISFRSSNAPSVTEGPGNLEVSSAMHTTTPNIAAVPDVTNQTVAEQEVDESACAWQSHLLAFSKGQAVPKAQAKAYPKPKAKGAAVAKQVSKKRKTDEPDLMPPPPAPPANKEGKRSLLVDMNPVEAKDVARMESKRAKVSDVGDVHHQDADGKWQSAQEQRFKELFDIQLRYENPSGEDQVSHVKSALSGKTKDANKFLNDVSWLLSGSRSRKNLYKEEFGNELVKSGSGQWE